MRNPFSLKSKLLQHYIEVKVAERRDSLPKIHLLDTKNTLIGNMAWLKCKNCRNLDTTKNML